MNLLAYPVFEGILLLGVVCDAKAMLQLVTNKTDYEGAVQQCIENGGHLVLPLNETQNMELARLLPRRGRAWLYLYSPYGLITQPSVMKQMTFVNWMRHHPDLSKGMCVRIRKNQKWESTNCSKEGSFVCKLDPRPQTPSNLLPTTETNEPDDNNPGPTSEGNDTMRPHIETSSIAPTHRDSSLSSSNTGVIIGAIVAVLAVIASLVVGVYIMRRRSVSRSSMGGDITLSAANFNASDTYEEVEPSFVPDSKNPGVGQGRGYTSVNLDPDNAVTPYQALFPPGTHANDVTAVVQDYNLYSPGSNEDDVSPMVQDNDLYSPGTDVNDASAMVQDNDLYSPGSNEDDVSTMVQANDLLRLGSSADDVSAMVQDNDLYSPGSDLNDVSAVVLDNDLYSPGSDLNDVSAVVQDNDLYSPRFDLNDVSAVVQDNDLYSPVTDAEAVNAMITESSHGIDRNVDGISMVDNELYSSENDPQPAPVYLELLPLQDATE